MNRDNLTLNESLDASSPNLEGQDATLPIDAPARPTASDQATVELEGPKESPRQDNTAVCSGEPESTACLEHEEATGAGEAKDVTEHHVSSDGTYHEEEDKDRTELLDQPETWSRKDQQAEQQGDLSDRTFEETLAPTPASTKTQPRTPSKIEAPLPKKVAGYEILGELGRGGMGVVYKARQPGANRLVALKMILNGCHAGPDQMARFRLEGEAVAHLQHPNIVQLYEVGEEEGCPFFSLEFVDGASLDKKVAGTPQPPREAAQVVLKLALALQLAHSRGIIHRDLKPANILLTAEGEPKVTDFGLAKRFEDKSDGPTHSGAIMGTPSYMAPEQAAGRTREIGPAADIYSLGAILYDLLTGRPPFRGTTILETLQQVQSMEPLAPRRLQPGVPGDVQTICLKALEKNPARRYASMANLAEDLRRYLAGEPIAARPSAWYERAWKWARRKPAQASLMGVSALAVLLFLVLGGLWLDSERRAALEREEDQRRFADLQTENAARAREQAEREQDLRKLADRNYQRAKKAVEQMLTRVAREKLAHIPQMEKVRRDLLKEARGFFLEFLAERSDDPEVRIEASLAQKRLGDIQEMLGQPREAEASYLAALDLLGKLTREKPERIDLKRDLAAGLGNLGNLLLEQKRLKEAEEAYRAVCQTRKSLADAQPDDATLAGELAQARLNFGVVLFVQNRLKEARVELEEGQALLAPLVAAAPGNKTFRADLARLHFNLARLSETSESPLEAAKFYEQAAHHWNALAEKDPTNPEHRFDLARVEQQRGDLFRDSQPEPARTHYEKALAIRADLVKDFPAVPAYRQGLARTHDHLAILHLAAGRRGAAGAAFQEALKIRDQARLDFPDLPEMHRALAASHANWGVQLLTAARFKEAEEALLKSRDLLETLVEKHPEEADFKKELAGVHHNLATVLHQTGRTDMAKTFCDQSVQLWHDLAERFPDSPEYRKELAQARLNLGSFQVLLRQTPQAEKTFSQAVTDLEKVTRAHPELVDQRHLLAIGLNNLGGVLRDAGKTGEAEDCWTKAQKEYRGLNSDHPGQPAYSQELARSLDGWAVYLAGQKRFPEAEQAWKEAIDLQQALLGKDPARPDYRRELAISHNNRGVLKALQGNGDGAEKECRRAIDLLEEYEAKLAPDPAYLGEIIKAHRNLASLVSASDAAAADASRRRILQAQEKLVRAFPAVAAYRLETIATLNELGNQRIQREDFEAALRLYEKAVDHLKTLGSDPAQAETARQNLYLMRLNTATAALGLKDHAKAAKVLGELFDTKGLKEPQHVLAASLLARCSALAQKDGSISPEEGQTLARSHADQAMKLLDRAVAEGFSDVAVLRGADFQPLREREDFVRLLGILEGKTKGS